MQPRGQSLGNQNIGACRVSTAHASGGVSRFVAGVRGQNRPRERSSLKCHRANGPSPSYGGAGSRASRYCGYSVPITGSLPRRAIPPPVPHTGRSRSTARVLGPDVRRGIGNPKIIGYLKSCLACTSIHDFSYWKSTRQSGAWKFISSRHAPHGEIARISDVFPRMHTAIIDSRFTAPAL
jgi:hypothetical protein